MRRNILFLVVGLLVGAVLATGVSTWAVDQQVKLVVNGKEVVFADAPPQMINGRTMVPARPLAEALGAKVAWDQETRTVRVMQAASATATQTVLRTTVIEILQAKYPGVTIGFRGTLITIGEAEYDVAPTLVENRVYLDVNTLLSAGVITASDLASK